MIERIQELSEQAANHMHKTTGQTWGINPAQIPLFEKFAELIIKECIDLLNPEGDPYTSLREDYGRSLSMNMIKKHFGIE